MWPLTSPKAEKTIRIQYDARPQHLLRLGSPILLSAFDDTEIWRFCGSITHPTNTIHSRSQFIPESKAGWKGAGSSEANAEAFIGLCISSRSSFKLSKSPENQIML